MAPNTEKDTVIPEVREEKQVEYKRLVAPQADNRKHEILYKNLILHTYWHVAAIYGIYLCFTSNVLWSTIFLNCFLFVVGNLGITVGAHRYWAHRSFKAKMPLQILLMLMNCVSFQNTAFDWARNHTLHHKYSDTDADPHNATRGLFFSHIGWLFVKKHPELIKRGKKVDFSHLINDPVLKFQKKYAVPLIGMLCFILPTVIPMYFWGESFNHSYHITLLRFVSNLNVIFLVNSYAHFWGYKPYDKTMLAAQSYQLALVTFGEGFHNYHHVFPMDYRSSELGNRYTNLSKSFIDFFAWLGWAYDLKTANESVVEKRALRTGDGTDLWGYQKKRNDQ